MNGLNSSSAIFLGRPHWCSFSSGPTTITDRPEDRERLNVNGGAIALGHPIGCTGARITVTLLHEMLKRRAKRGIATLCVSGGMGMALALENAE